MKTVTILAPSFTLMSISTLSPALNSISEAFPLLSSSAIQLLCTIPSFVGFPLILLSGRLASIFTKKQILIVSLAFMMIGGLMPILFHTSYAALVIASCIYGIGFGGISPMTTALINEHCPPTRQAGMMGLQSAIIGLGGVCFSYLGGLLANIRWWYSYFTFFLFVPVLLLTLLLPKGRTVHREQNHGKSLWYRLLYYLGHALLLNCFIGVFLTNISILISENGLGNADVAGTVTAFYSVASILGGMAAALLITRLKVYALSAITLNCAFGALILWKGTNIPSVLLGTFLLGTMYAMRMPAGYTRSVNAVPPESATMAISLYCCFAQLGNFLSPLVIHAVSRGSTASSHFLTAGVLLGGLTLLSFGREYLFHKRYSA